MLGRYHRAQDRRCRDQAQAREETRDRPEEQNAEIKHRLMPSESGDEPAEAKHGAEITEKEITEAKRAEPVREKYFKIAEITVGNHVRKNHKIAEITVGKHVRKNHGDG